MEKKRTVENLHRLEPLFSQTVSAYHDNVYRAGSGRRAGDGRRPTDQFRLSRVSGKEPAVAPLSRAFRPYRAAPTTLPGPSAPPVAWEHTTCSRGAADRPALHTPTLTKRQLTQRR